MLTNNTYIPSNSTRQYPNFLRTQKSLQKKLSCDKSKNDYLWYKMESNRDVFRRLSALQKTDTFGRSNLQKNADHFFEYLVDYVREKHYNLKGNKINISQKILAKSYWNSHPSTIGRYLERLKKFRITVDTKGDPADRYYKKNYRKQYIIDFSGFFEAMEEALIQRRENYIYRITHLSKLDRKEKEKVNNSVDKMVDNQAQKEICPSKNAGYKEDINIFYEEEPTKEKNKNDAQEISTLSNTDDESQDLGLSNRSEFYPEKEDEEVLSYDTEGEIDIPKVLNRSEDPRKIMEKLSIYRRIERKMKTITEEEAKECFFSFLKNPEKSKFAPLFSWDKIQEFDLMNEQDRAIFLDFRRRLAIYQKKKYPASDWLKQEEANQVLAMVNGLKNRQPSSLRGSRLE